MPGVARVGVDSAGGIILGGNNSFVYVNNALAAVVGDLVSPHGEPPHNASTLITGSSNVFINGIPICRQGDEASCGHLISSGSTDVKAG